jgi:hypothetical protein
VGRAVSSASSAQRARVEAALGGRLAPADLTEEERVLLNAELDAGIEETLGRVDVAADLAAGGVTTVALDEDGNLVVYRTDGSTAIVGSL